MTDASPDWRTDTAERPRVGSPAVVPGRATTPPREPRLPPSAVEPPPPARFPLYADEVSSTEGDHAGADQAGSVATWSYREAGATEHGAAWLDGLGGAYADDERRSPLLWIAVALVVVAMVGVVWWFLARG